MSDKYTDTDKVDRAALQELKATYHSDLLNNTVPFWFPRSIDHEYGGFFTSFNRDGTLLDSDKSIWFQGRFIWMLCTLYSTVGKRAEWLEYAERGIEFLTNHGFDRDGRMFFSVTRAGLPVRKRERYIFSEAFAIMAFAAYAKVSGKQIFKNRALQLFKETLYNLQEPGVLAPKTNPSTRPLKSLAVPMILLVTAQELRKVSDDPLCEEVINNCLIEVERDFYKPEMKCVLENTGPQGEFYNTWDGRQLNPGHSIELGWFILEEARVRNNERSLVELGCNIIKTSLETGWDDEFGGIYYFRDAKGLPSTEYWHDMKFWWPHCETLIATLMAYQATGDKWFYQWHQKTFKWSHHHFADTKHGEWYGYLHRSGSVSTPIKGNLWKGFYHLPRMQWKCWQTLNDITGL